MQNYIIAGFLLVFGLTAVIMGIKMIHQRNKVSSWPQVNCVFLEKKVDIAKHASGPGGMGKSYEVFVVYTYEVNGKKYTHDRIAPSFRTSDLRTAKRDLEEIEPIHKVFYNPDNPQEAYLLAESLGWGIFILIIGIVLTLIGMIYGISIFIP